ncbi:hypothetical protein EV200_10685 [Pedobacter psychrotolerans]|uniref:Uncharacterized protein n=2 Tax=Pedobacter psychrotolerans TaxID=1843235 RepID=A0A4R2H7M0_9SPHI|nr:hypothetical protein [Pedobacter psychrotolerans]TCO22445.1 hypothetical protein EV200_10685 [Pedobacter psychrotolerans]
MKKIISICMLVLCVVSLTTYATPEVPKPVSSIKAKVTTYNVRLGYRNLDGSVTTSVSTESPGFTIYNQESGDDYYAENGPSSFGTFLPYQLPGTINGLPAGTYEFSAERGQGNWTGYGSITVTLSPEMIGADGYVTVYVPIAWVE